MSVLHRNEEVFFLIPVSFFRVRHQRNNFITTPASLLNSHDDSTSTMRRTPSSRCSRQGTRTTWHFPLQASIVDQTSFRVLDGNQIGGGFSYVGYFLVLVFFSSVYFLKFKILNSIFKNRE